MHSDCPGLVHLPVEVKVLMEPIIIVFIKLMGAAISGYWDLRGTGTSRDYNTLVRFLGWQCECTAHTLPGAVPVAR